MTTRYWIVLWLLAFTIAFTLRYVLARFFLTLHFGGTGHGIPMNIIGFWLVLGIAGLITLLKLVHAK
jgi:hypothetical protein